MNKERLLAIKAHILEEPKRLAMGEWIQDKSSPNDKVVEHYHERELTEHEFPACGTAACIGGWGRILFSSPDDDEYCYSTILGIHDEEISDELFLVSLWDEPYRTKYMNAETPEERAPIAGAYIDYFIEKYGE